MRGLIKAAVAAAAVWWGRTMVVSVWSSCVAALWFTWGGYGGKKKQWS